MLDFFGYYLKKESGLKYGFEVGLGDFFEIIGKDEFFTLESVVQKKRKVQVSIICFYYFFLFLVKGLLL